ncbi:Phenylalanine--tRNA ligase alpha subunit [Bifiguratus adelaidae]|uniref:phenylalanine--tRNA ligase n=1 Tax=Bifiguratus adelaidae TaxID=1938954 RepID=A0A261Y4Z5_9FUNG|nr:Phenylalanine--tRNA ligase alpha subunit [Bifiguratus adelaidae]
MMVDYIPITREVWALTSEGQDLARNGSHEAVFFNLVPTGSEGIALEDLKTAAGASAAVGQRNAMKNKWIRLENGQVFRQVDAIVDETQKALQEIDRTASHPNANVLKDLKKRKLCDKQKITSYKIVKGPKFATTITKQSTDLTSDMLQRQVSSNGEWKTADFKPYNFNAIGLAPPGGHLHPLMKVREEFRRIFFEMGFEEMPTNKFVESSFWNFDALFQPQQHPARDAHDTFFIKDPATSDRLPADLMAKVKKTHEDGGDTGSTGYRYEWKVEEAEKLLLRTHTTAVSSYMLYKLAQEPEFRPAKYFSIDRVFRNESVDATHLAEFHQLEGVIADRNLTLGDLIGFMDIFFKKMGIEKIRFKPAYNPYTEPSMEIFSWHEGLKKWVEIGNSGMFRPEMLGPLGLPSDVRVIAWGLGLERPTMIKYGISNIRDLLGHKVNLSMVEEYPICRMDKKMGKELVGITPVGAAEVDETTEKLAAVFVPVQLSARSLNGLNDNAIVALSNKVGNESSTDAHASTTTASGFIAKDDLDTESHVLSILPGLYALALGQTYDMNIDSATLRKDNDAFNAVVQGGQQTTLQNGQPDLSALLGLQRGDMAKINMDQDYAGIEAYHEKIIVKEYVVVFMDWRGRLLKAHELQFWRESDYIKVELEVKNAYVAVANAQQQQAVVQS